MPVNCLFAALILFSFEQPSVNVIGYHAFTGSGNLYSFSIDELRLQIDFLSDMGYSFVSHDDIIKGNITGSKNILVTVDDGHKSAHKAWRKVFKPRDINPLLAVYPAVIGRTGFALTWEQLLEMADAGCEVASHGYYHLKINRELYDKDPDAFMREIYYSKEVLEKRLGRPVDLFVYPYGIKSDLTVEHLKKAGYDYAYSVSAGSLISPPEADAAYDLPRYLFTRENSERILAVITGTTPSSESVYSDAVPGNPDKTASGSSTRKKRDYSETSQRSENKNIITEIDEKHVEQVRELFHRVVRDIYDDYSVFHEEINRKIRQNGERFGNLFDLKRDENKRDGKGGGKSE